MNGTVTRDEYESCLVGRISQEAYDKLKQGKVAVAGLGGLGSNISLMLARCGVGELHLIDFDEVDLSNVHRQAYYLRHVGKKKTEALAEMISQINPYVKLRLDDTRVTRECAAELFRGDEIICEAFDRAETKAMLMEEFLMSEKLRGAGKKLVSGSGLAGFASANTIRTRKIFPCVYQCGDGVSDSGNGLALTSARVMVCAAHQANMVLRLLLGEEEP